MVPRRVTIPLVSLVVSLTVGCGSKPVVGELRPRTGAASANGDAIASGADLAVQKAREVGRLPEGFEVLWADTASDPEQALEELRRLASERSIHLVIGGATSAEAQALIPHLEELDVICLSPSATAPELTKESRFFFRIYPSDELEGSTAGQFLKDRLHRDTVLLYAADSDYTRSIEPEFRNQYEERLGGEVVGRIDLSVEGWQQESRRVLTGTSPARRCGRVSKLP